MYFLSMKTEPVTRMSGRNDKCLAQKPDINRCIRSNCDRLDFYAGMQIMQGRGWET